MKTPMDIVAYVLWMVVEHVNTINTVSPDMATGLCIPHNFYLLQFTPRV